MTTKLLRNILFRLTNSSLQTTNRTMATQAKDAKHDDENLAKSRNIEIKARVGGDDEFQKRIDIAKKLTESDGETIPQHDVFFNATNGRLKLRYLQKRPSQLIQYNRPDVEGPKLSQFNVLETENPKLMEQILNESIGIKGRVKKTRYLFMYKQTRIHLDNVENLGNFMEFEVSLQPDETIEYGTEIANFLMKEFGIKNEDLMTGAYLDELLKK